MEFAGISSGAPVRARGDVDVATVIAEAVDAVSAATRAIAASTSPCTRTATLPPVVGDADALRSAVQNIVGNAVKYSPSGGTRRRRAAASPATARARFASPIAASASTPTDLPHIFKPFYRGRRAVDAQVRGTGVGLSVVRHVIDAHGGTIAVDSRAGEGTTVVVELPARRRGRGRPARRGGSTS